MTSRGACSAHPRAPPASRRRGPASASRPLGSGVTRGFAAGRAEGSEVAPRRGWRRAARERGEGTRRSGGGPGRVRRRGLQPEGRRAGGGRGGAAGPGGSGRGRLVWVPGRGVSQSAGLPRRRG